MAWVADLASTLGVPLGGTLAATAIFTAAVAAEKEARPEALRQIAILLQDPSWARGLEPTRIVQGLFLQVFGNRQLSWKCVRRSILASSISLVSLSCLFHSSVFSIYNVIITNFLTLAEVDSIPPIWYLFLWFLLFVYLIFCSIIPDYIAVAKT